MVRAAEPVHGKTSLVDALLRQTGAHSFRKGETIDLVNINKVDITAIKPTIVVSTTCVLALMKLTLLPLLLLTHMW